MQHSQRMQSQPDQHLVWQSLKSFKTKYEKHQDPSINDSASFGKVNPTKTKKTVELLISIFRALQRSSFILLERQGQNNTKTPCIKVRFDINCMIALAPPVNSNKKISSRLQYINTNFMNSPKYLPKKHPFFSFEDRSIHYRINVNSPKHSKKQELQDLKEEYIERRNANLGLQSLHFQLDQQNSNTSYLYMIPQGLNEYEEETQCIQFQRNSPRCGPNAITIVPTQQVDGLKTVPLLLPRPHKYNRYASY